MTAVNIAWRWIDFDPKETKKLITRLETARIPMTLIDRAVYVIRLQSPFAISYPTNYTPTLYIGEGNLVQRLNAHREWTANLQSIGYTFPIKVAICCPRVRNGYDAYRNFEAHLLKVFFDRYGSLPLKNSIHEHNAYDHTYERVATSGILGPGRQFEVDYRALQRRAVPYGICRMHIGFWH